MLLPPVPFPAVKSPPWIMNCLITLWNPLPWIVADGRHRSVGSRVSDPCCGRSVASVWPQRRSHLEAKPRLAGAELPEVLSRLWDVVTEKAHDNSARRHAPDLDIEVYFRGDLSHRVGRRRGCPECTGSRGRSGVRSAAALNLAHAAWYRHRPAIHGAVRPRVRPGATHGGDVPRNALHVVERRQRRLRQ